MPPRYYRDVALTTEVIQGNSTSSLVLLHPSHDITITIWSTRVCLTRHLPSIPFLRISTVYSADSFVRSVSRGRRVWDSKNEMIPSSNDDSTDGVKPPMLKPVCWRRMQPFGNSFVFSRCWVLIHHRSPEATIRRGNTHRENIVWTQSAYAYKIARRVCVIQRD